MNLLIVFAFAGDSTMTRFLAIAERPKLPPRRRNSSRAHHARAYEGLGMIERATITPRREKAKITTPCGELFFFFVVRAAGGFVLFRLVVERLVGDAED